MFFLKKIREEISDLRDQIDGHQQMADMLLIKIQSHETSVKNLLDRSEEHTSAIIEIDDICDARVALPANRMARAAIQTRPDRRNIAKMWSVLGVKTGVELDIKTDAGDVETWFIASIDPETLKQNLEVEMSVIDGNEIDQQDTVNSNQ